MQVAWIETFLTIVERGGFCAAADSLFRSQSRVSAHVASLELALGAPLFDRRQRPVALTPAGEAFLAFANSAKSSLDAGAAAVRAVQDGRAGRVGLAIYPGACAAFLPPVLADLAGDRPELRVEIVEQPTGGLDRALLDGSVEIAIRPRLPRLAHPAVNREALWCERMVAVVSREHPLARIGDVRLADLAHKPVIANDEAVATLRAGGFQPEVAFAAEHPSMLVACVARGLGVGLIHEFALQSVATDGVVVLELADPIERVVDVCWVGEIHLRSSVAAVLDAIRRAPAPALAGRPKRAATGVLHLVKPHDEIVDCRAEREPMMAAARA